MIKRLLAVDGVMAVCQFRDDGALVEGYGMPDEQQLAGLAKFALDYKRMVQGNADQLSMFTQVNGWTPPGGWIVKGPAMSVCSVGNIACVINNNESALNEVMQELQEAARW
ncbi:MAG: DUF2173 family protein [Gammaproteobacteria bacterium]|nr:DUF2173 family protein [Gammaproteobacteria bacterium]MDH5650920.1 DUF2173 family protein [Gammaproteobacteria bacterium]